MTASLTPTVTRFEEYLVGERGLGTATAHGYALDIARWEVSPFRAGAEESADATVASLVRWIDNARRTASASYTRRIMAAAKAYCGWLGLDTDRLAKYRTPPVKPADPHPVPGGIGSVERMIAATTNVHIRLAIALGAYAGLRISETLSVTLDDLVGDVLWIKGKGEKMREIPISTTLRRHIARNQAASRPGHELAVPLPYSTTRAEISRIASEVGLDGVSSHDLRATFATQVYEKTKDILLVARLMGHASVTTTQAYIGNRAGAAAAVEF